jgi:NADPH:quinone reductase
VGQYINLGDGSLTKSVRSASVGRGVEVVLDVVVGPLFEPCLRCLTYRERHISVTSTGDGRVGFDLVDFYHREGRIYGVDTLKLGFAESAAVLRAVMPGIQRETFPPPEFEAATLEQAVRANGHINDGTARKKSVIIFPA